MKAIIQDGVVTVTMEGTPEEIAYVINMTKPIAFTWPTQTIPWTQPAQPWTPSWPTITTPIIYGLGTDATS